MKVPVAPTFGGLRIADTERVPEPLRGRLIPWMQVCGINNSYAYFLDRRDQVVTYDGHRVNGVFSKEREARIARRLLERELRRRLDSGELDLLYERRPESPWVILLGGALLPLMILPLAIMGGVSLLEYFRDIGAFEPHGVRLMLIIVGIATALIWPALFIAFIAYAVADNRLRPLSMGVTERGLKAALPKGRVIDREWPDLQRVDSSCLTFSGGRRVRLPHDERLLALSRALRRDRVGQADRSLLRVWLFMAIASAIAFLLAMAPLIVLMRAGYLERIDLVRMSRGLSLMIGMLLIPFGVISLMAVRSDAKARRQQRSHPA